MRFQAFMPDILHWLGVQKVRTLFTVDACLGTYRVTP